MVLSYAADTQRYATLRNLICIELGVRTISVVNLD